MTKPCTSGSPTVFALVYPVATDPRVVCLPQSSRVYDQALHLPPATDPWGVYLRQMSQVYYDP